MVRIAVVITAVKTHVADLTLCVGPSMMPTFNPKGDVVVVAKRAGGVDGTTNATRGRRSRHVADESDAIGV